jgi:hypothetical protein
LQQPTCMNLGFRALNRTALAKISGQGCSSLI